MADEKLSAELSAIRDREAKASPGPWKVDREFLTDMDDTPFTFDAIVGPDGMMTGETMADMQFTAHARTDVPRLLAALDRVLKLTGEARATFSRDPADCTNTCADGPCTCSGKTRPVAWNLDPEALRAAILAGLTGEAASRE